MKMHLDLDSGTLSSNFEIKREFQKKYMLQCLQILVSNAGKK